MRRLLLVLPLSLLAGCYYPYGYGGSYGYGRSYCAFRSIVITDSV